MNNQSENWQIITHETGFELHITAEALAYIDSVLSDPYLRLGAEKGGCSGWLYVVRPESHLAPEDIVLKVTDKISVVVNSQQAEELLQKIHVFMKTLSYGVQLKVEKREEGMHCGCGESFQ